MTSRRSAAAAVLGVASLAAGAQPAVEILPAQGNVFVVAGPAGNTVVQTGDEAVVVVDTQTAAVAEQVLAAIGTLSAKPIRHIVNTSAGLDHTGGNETLSRAGTYVRLIDTFDPRGSNTDASIMAHVNVLARMSSPTGTTAPTPAAAWPSDTYFTGEWALFVNGEAIELLHVPAAHSDGDTMVFFRRSDVLAAGDIFSPSRYPTFDSARGGSITGVIEGLNRIIDIAIPGENQQGGTVVVPGHGRISDETEVSNYRDMVTIVRDRVAALIESGMSLEQVLAAAPSSDYDGIYTDESVGITGTTFVTAVYRDLKGEAQ